VLEKRILGNVYIQMAMPYIGKGDCRLRKPGMLYAEGIRLGGERPI
jgi:hypothetical protein